MESVKSILVALSRDIASPQALKRAIALARRYEASLHLFLCDSDSAYVLQHRYDRDGVAAARQSSIARAYEYLHEQWNAFAIKDVRCDFDAVCESPLYEAIARKVAHSSPDLVIRAIDGDGSNHGSALSGSDWELVRTCPAALLLTRGRTWSERQRLAVAIDISGDEKPGLTHAILRAAAQFSCPGATELELLYGCGRMPGVSMDLLRDELARRAAEAGAKANAYHVLAGDPATSIAAFAATRNYDVMVLGALTHHKAPTALVGTLTGKLIERVDCDLLLVKPGTQSAARTWS